MSCGQMQEGPEGQPTGATSMPRKRTVRRTDKSKCGRCREARSMYIVRSIAYCKECFLSNFVNRIMRRLYPPLHAAGPSRINHGLSRPRQVQGSVLVPVSGGAGSMAVLDVLRRNNFVGDGQGRVANKTTGEKEAIWDQGIILYVEFAAVTGMADRMDDMRRLAEQLSMSFVGVRAEDAFAGETGSQGKTMDACGVDLGDPALRLHRIYPLEGTGSSDAADALRSFLAGLSGPSRPAFLEQILQSAIRSTIRDRVDISHIIVGETSTRESERVISGTALGRGWSLPLELATAENIYNPSGRQAQRIKPMKDITLREAAIYCHLREIETRNARSWASGHISNKAAASLEALTEAFIARLDVTHPSTVSTINKTGEKLRFSGERGAQSRCPACDAPVQTSAMGWKSRTALTSLEKPASNPTEVHDSSSQDDLPQPASLAKYLCYSCLTMFTPSSNAKGRKQSADTAANDLASLPDFIARGYLRRRELDPRSQISQFLLFDDGTN